MVFVLVWTIGNASSMACQSLVHLVYSSMSSGLLTQSKVQHHYQMIRCGTIEKVAMELLPRMKQFGFMHLPSVALRFVSSSGNCKIIN